MGPLSRCLTRGPVLHLDKQTHNALDYMFRPVTAISHLHVHPARDTNQSAAAPTLSRDKSSPVLKASPRSNSSPKHHNKNARRFNFSSNRTRNVCLLPTSVILLLLPHQKRQLCPFLHAGIGHFAPSPAPETAILPFLASNQCPRWPCGSIL